MQKLCINGGKRLSGEIKIQGAKNSVLPILAATTLCSGEVILKNCPRISDTYSALQILTTLGCKASFCDEDKNVIKINSEKVSGYEITEDLMQKMRSSIFFLGALIGKMGRCSISYPGGCDIGIRPIDIHIKALKKMGVLVRDEHGYIDFKVKTRLKGSKIPLSFPSVGATENIILAGVLADGTTEIHNAAREPEIVDLAKFLVKCGAKSYGAGTDKIVIHGVEKLEGCEYTIMPDRIATATYLSAAAITAGEITIKDANIQTLESVISLYEQIGCVIHGEGDKIFFSAKKNPLALDTVRTQIYPGFPTDCQAFLMANMLIAKGTTVFVENIFENRFLHVPAFRKMGADIRIEGRVAVVEGVSKLYGAKVTASDLRGGAGLVVAALAAEGETEIYGIHHIDRGYEDIEEALTKLGASICRK